MHLGHFLLRCEEPAMLLTGDLTPKVLVINFPLGVTLGLGASRISISSCSLGTEYSSVFSVSVSDGGVGDSLKLSHFNFLFTTGYIYLLACGGLEACC